MGDVTRWLERNPLIRFGKWVFCWDRVEAGSRAYELIEEEAVLNPDWLGAQQWLYQFHRYLSEIDRLAHEPIWLARFWSLMLAWAGYLVYLTLHVDSDLAMMRSGKGPIAHPAELPLVILTQLLIYVFVRHGWEQVVRVRRRKLEDQVVSMMTSDSSLTFKLIRIGILCPIWEPKVQALVKQAQQRRGQPTRRPPAQ